MLPDNAELWRTLIDLHAIIVRLCDLRMVSHVAVHDLHHNIYFPYLQPSADDHFARTHRELLALGATTTHRPDAATPLDDQIVARMRAARVQANEAIVAVYADTVVRPPAQLDRVHALLVDTRRALAQLTADPSGAIRWIRYSVK